MFRAKFVYQNNRNMYTKTLLLAAFLILLPTILISGFSGNVQHTSTSKSADENKTKSSEEHKDLATDRTIAHDDNGSIKPTGSQHGEEDGKHHHFHFQRLQKRRSKYVLCLVAKSLLAIVHVAGLMMLFMHLLH